MFSNSAYQDDLLLAHAAATWALIGLIWIVQVVQYPGFLRVGSGELAEFHRHHCDRIGWVVAPLMGVELLTGVAVWWSPPPGLTTRFLIWGLGLIAVNWIWTAFVSVPLHRRLADGSRRAGALLTATNWVRTAAWSARGVWTLIALRGALGR